MIRSLATGKQVPPPQSLKTSPAPPPTPEEQQRFEERLKQAKANASAPVGAPLNKLPSEALTLRAWVHAHPRLLTGAQSDPMNWIPEELQQMHDWRLGKAHPLGEIPVIVIGVSRDDSANWQERRRQLDDLASLSTDGKVMINSSSGHHVQWDDPGFVVDMVRADYDSVRRHRRLAH